MKYELISKDVLDEALLNILHATQKSTNREIKLLLSRAFNSINGNRTYVNIQPEGK